jgi:hypothetical protein
MTITYGVDSSQVLMFDSAHNAFAQFINATDTRKPRRIDNSNPGVVVTREFVDIDLVWLL